MTEMFAAGAQAGAVPVRSATPPAAREGGRLFDRAVAIAALVALSPFLALIAILIRLESPGPALFRQTRIGRDGVPFTFYKLRSLRTGTDPREAGAGDRDGLCKKWQRHPRATRIGHVLRRTSVDELPQLVNVARGDMVLVGPRPALPSEVALYGPRAMRRLAVRPGITGLWQISGRADIGFDKMIDLDIAYIETRSFLLDLAILALTVRACLSRQGAY